jgi:hypothetical protein
MPREDLIASAASAGEKQPLTEEAVLGGETASKKKGDRKTRDPKEVAEILHPEKLEFKIERAGRPAKLVVPTVFTLGDALERKIYEDFDAYYRLVMIELGKVSSIDLVANPSIVFTDENLPYLSIALTTSNTLEFMRRVLSKSAYVLQEVDGEERRSRPSNQDIDQLNSASQITIGGHYVGRWIANWIKARNAKNPQRAE